MKTFKYLLLIVSLVSLSISAFPQGAGNILSYSYVMNEKGQLASYLFDPHRSINFLGNDGKNIIMYSHESTFDGEVKNARLSLFDMSSMKLLKTINVNPDKTLKDADIDKIILFDNRIFVLLQLNDRSAYKTSYYIEEFNTQTESYPKPPIKLYEGGGEKIINSDVYGISGLGKNMTVRFNATCVQLKSEESKEMVFMCTPVKKKEWADKMTVVVVDKDLNIESKNNYTFNEGQGKFCSFSLDKLYSKGHLFFSKTFSESTIYSKQSGGKEIQKYYMVDMANPTETHEIQFNKDNKYVLSVLENFMVDDSMVYYVATMGTMEKDKHGVSSYNEKGLYFATCSVKTGEIVNETTVDLTAKDFEDLKGDSKSADKTGKMSVSLYSCYNKFTHRMYVVYEPVTTVTKSNIEYTAGGNLKIKEFNEALDQTGSFTFTRAKGENGVIPVCTSESTCFLTDSRQKNEDYGNEPDFKMTGANSQYYALKVQDGKLNAYGYAFKPKGREHWTDLSYKFIDLVGNEKLFYEANTITGELNFIKIKFE